MHIAGPFVKIQPVRVLEERSRAAELLGLLVHGFYKRSDGIFGLGVKFFAHVFGKRDGGVVARGDHQAAQRLLDGELVAFEESRGRVAYGCRRVAHGDFLVHFAVLDREDCSHDLGDRGDFDLLVGATGIVDGAVFTHDKRIGGIDIGQVFGCNAACIGGFAADVIGREHLGAGDGRNAGDKGDGAGKANGQLRGTLYKRGKMLH